MTEITPEPQTPTAVPRPGVPVWRVGKPDAFLADATEAALAAIREIATEENIGKHIGARSEGIRCVTHLFECKLPGYVGWEWFATLTRVSRSKDVTVNEVGMLPTQDSVLAPPWVPWAERVRPEDAVPEPAPAVAEQPAQDPAEQDEQDEDDDAPVSDAVEPGTADDVDEHDH